MYDVVVTATWALTSDDGATATTTASRAMTFDAIKYDFRTLSPGVDGRGANQFVDSLAARMQVTATGCTQTGLLSLLPRSEPKPAPGVNPQNEVNSTAMTFISRGNPLLWEIPHPYWYGGSPSNDPPACCYSNAAKYELSLNPDGCDEHRQEISAHLPKSDLVSRMIALPGAVKNAKITVDAQETITNGDAVVVRTWFSLTDYEVPPAGSVSDAYRSQYYEKIKTEERTHMKQFMRTNGYGFEDMYSLEDALFNEGILIDDEYFDSSSELEADIKVSKIKKAFKNEKEISTSYWFKNRGYIEREAKKVAEYREAYLYHCTYEKEYGPGDKVPKSAIKTSLYNN